MRNLFLILLAAPLASGCVGKELRRTSSLTAAEVQSYNSDLTRFNAVHRDIIAEMDSEAAENAGLARVNDALVGARLAELKARGELDALRLFEAATPPIPALESDAVPVAPPRWDPGSQEALIKALNEVSAKRTTGQSAELILGFAFEVAQRMKKDAEKAGTASTGK